MTEASYAAVYNAGGAWWLAGGTLADRPPPGEQGRLYLVTDPSARSWTYDTGAGWISVGASEAAASILAKLKDVDGADSGLDADLLDGQQGSYYAAAQSLTDHANRTDNPHSTQHAQTNPAAVDPASTDTSRNKHLSNADEKANVDHRGRTDNPHAVTAAQAGAIATTEKNAAGGVAGLDPATGKLLAAQIPDTILGTVDYQGAWNAATNTPTLSDAGSAPGRAKGDYYVVSVAGATSIGGFTDWQPKDWVVWNGSSWDKVDNTDSVTSVFGRRGAVVAQAGDYTAAQVSFSPGGTLAAQTVQAAIEELMNEKLDAGHAGTGGTAHANAVANGAAGFMSGADKAKLDGIAQGGGTPDATTTVSGKALASVNPPAGRGVTFVELADPRFVATRECELTRSADQSVPNNAFTAISADVETADPQGWHDPANPTRVSPGQAGVFDVYVHTSWAVNATGIRGQAISKNGVALGTAEPRAFFSAGVNSSGFQNNTFRVRLASTDFFEVHVFQNSGGALALALSSKIHVVRVL